MRRRRRPPTSIFLFVAGRPTAQPIDRENRGRATYTTPGSSGPQTTGYLSATSTAADNNRSKPSKRKLKQLTPGVMCGNDGNCGGPIVRCGGPAMYAGWQYGRPNAGRRIGYQPVSTIYSSDN